MGSHHKKKKGTDDSRIIIADIKRDVDQDAVRTALLPSTDHGFNPIMRSMIDFVNVTETTDPSQG
jgi:hypothetical protein